MDLAKANHRIKAAVDGLLLGEGLRAKVMRGGVWLGGGSVAEQATRFGRNMLLTRLLAPGAFGTMAIVLSSAAFVENLTDVGTRPAVIQNRRGGEAAYLNAAWWLTMGRAIGVYAIIFAMAPWVGGFYGNEELSSLLRVALLSTLLGGAMSPRSNLVQREMNFSRWAVITNGGAICGVVATVVLGLVVRDVWALAIGYCSENVFRCILSYILCPGLPSLSLDRHAARDLLKFSRGIFGLSFLNLIFARTDVFLLGKLYSPTALGLYTMAVFLVQTPQNFLIGMINQTLLPALSGIQNDTSRLNRILTEVTSSLFLLGMPVVAAICLCAPSLLTVLYGAQYASAAGALAVASGVVFLNSLNSLITCAFYAGGRPGLHRRAVAASAVIMLISIYPACKYLGVVGGQVAALIAIVVSYLLQIMGIQRLTGLNLLRLGKASAPTALVFGGILVAGFCARFFGAIWPRADLALDVGACVIGFALSVQALRRIRAIG